MIPAEEAHETNAKLHQIELPVDHQMPRERPAECRRPNRLTEIRTIQPSNNRKRLNINSTLKNDDVSIEIGEWAIGESGNLL